MKTLIASTIYGYQELRLVYQRNMTIALSFAVTVFLTCIGGYQANQWSHSTNKNVGEKHDTITVIFRDWQPPIDPIQRGGFIPVLSANIGKGLPVPVPDMNVDTSIEYASQKQLSQSADEKYSRLDPSGEGGKIIIPEPLYPKPDSFVAIEQEPRIVLNPSPQYPDLPRRAGIEGFVFLKVLISAEGKVKNAILLKSSDDLFVQSAKDAAMKWVFTPALMNGKPVPVWVSIPFRFRLTMK